MSIFLGHSAFPLTPASPEGRVDTDALARLVDRIGAGDAQSVGLLGSTGIYMYLSRAERARATRAAAEALSGRLPLMVGVGALRTDEAVSHARDAAAAGADALLLAPVSYTPLTEEEVFQHYRAVAAATDLPLVIYNNPGTTRFSFSDDLLARLARLPGIGAVKMPLPPGGDVGAELARLRPRLPEGFPVGYSQDWGCAEALLAGADTWFSAAGGTLPGPVGRLARAARAGDAAEARRLDAAFGPLWVLFRELGGLRVLFALLNCLGLSPAQPPAPILPLDATDRDRVRAALETLPDAVGAPA